MSTEVAITGNDSAAAMPDSNPWVIFIFKEKKQKPPPLFPIFADFDNDPCYFLC